MKKIWVGMGISLLLASAACRTKSELRREQELEKLKTEVKEARNGKVDMETTVEEMRTEMARLSGLSEQQAAQIQGMSEELKGQINTLSTRTQALEQKQVASNQTATPTEEVAKPGSEGKRSLDSAKALYDEGKYDHALEILKSLVASPANGEEGRKAQYLLAESYFASKDYPSAALEFAEFRKKYPKDSMVPSAIYKQATSFKNMGKKQEAKLFYQDLIDRYPASPFTSRAKGDIRKIK